MKCPVCGTDLADGKAYCTTCGAALQPSASPASQPSAGPASQPAPEAEPQPTVGDEVSNPAARRIRVAFGILMALVFLLVAAVAVLTPATGPAPAPAPSGVPTASVAPTAPPVDPDRAAVEAAINGFYATIDAGKPVTKSAYVYPKGTGGVAPRALDTSGTTVFHIARAVIGSGTADVYGRESRSVIATPGAEVEFRLRHVEGEWLISSWRQARDTTLAPQALTLSDVTARDVVGTLLQAHQVGDAGTVRLLTTPAFQALHGSWLDGTDRSALMTSWRIVSARPKGDAFLVVVDERWLPKALTSTYTVVMSGGEILVSGWSWK
jgi:hypothetical protein